MNRRFIALSAIVVIAAVAVFVLRPTEPTIAADITPEMRATFEQAATELNIPVESLEAVHAASIVARNESASGTMSSGPNPYELAVRTCYGEFVMGWASYGPCGSGANGNVCVAYRPGMPATPPVHVHDPVPGGRLIPAFSRF